MQGPQQRNLTVTHHYCISKIPCQWSCPGLLHLSPVEDGGELLRACFVQLPTSLPFQAKLLTSVLIWTWKLQDKTWMCAGIHICCVMGCFSDCTTWGYHMDKILGGVMSTRGGLWAWLGSILNASHREGGGGGVPKVLKETFVKLSLEGKNDFWLFSHVGW